MIVCMYKACHEEVTPNGDYCPHHLIGFKKEADLKSNVDMVNHPPHYTKHPSGVECIQITRHMGFNIGNAVKYLWRADLKDKPIEDLEKAIFYIKDEIEKRKREAK